MNKYDYKYLNPFKWFILENFPFIEADFDALTNWQLFCKLGKEMNKIIDNLNSLGIETENLSQAFIDLQNYVNDYFENLDVQEEINTKLDEMAEDGTLAELIAQYLQLQGLLCYNNLNELKNANNIAEGSFVKTYGRLKYNDGEGFYYKIRDLINTDIIDNDEIVSLTNFPNLIAEKIHENEINGIFGAINSTYHEYYIDGLLGNDNNTGYSTSAPFKTLKPILNLINKGKLKIDINLKSGQTFVLPFNNDNIPGFSACTIHLRTYGGTEKATITRNMAPNINKSIVWYNCHANINNINIENIGYDMYWDAGSVVLTNCICNCKLTFWGAFVRFTDCKIHTIKARGANLWIESSTTYGDSELGCIDSINSKWCIYRTRFRPDWAINNESANNAFFSFISSSILVFGLNKVYSDNLTLNNKLIYGMGSEIRLASGIVKETAFTCATTSPFYVCSFISTLPRYNELKNTCDGFNISDGTVIPT